MLVPYSRPQLLAIDFRDCVRHDPIITACGYPRTEPIPGLELLWDGSSFGPAAAGRLILLRLSLTVSMMWQDEASEGTRFVLSVERPNAHPPLPESEFARGDASAPAGERHSFALSMHYGPIVAPTDEDPIRLRARWSTIAGGRSVMDGGLHGINEFSAYAYLFEGAGPDVPHRGLRAVEE